jgi:hypothetical protein
MLTFCLTIFLSTLHQAYVELSMSLIESFLQEIGISDDAFAAGTYFAVVVLQFHILDFWQFQLVTKASNVAARKQLFSHKLLLRMTS